MVRCEYAWDPFRIVEFVTDPYLIEMLKRRKVSQGSLRRRGERGRGREGEARAKEEEV